MNRSRFNYLLKFQRAKALDRQHSKSVPSKRQTKANCKAIGQVLKHSRVHGEVSLERVFVKRT